MSRENQFRIKFVKHWMYLYTFPEWEYFSRLQLNYYKPIFKKTAIILHKFAVGFMPEGVKNIPTLEKYTSTSIVSQT